MNAPASFQRFIKKCLQGYQNDFVVPYLDDLLIYSASFYDHILHLRLVFERLHQCGVKIKASKCQFFKHEVSYVGRVISAEGYTNDPKQIASIASRIKMKPNNIADLRSMLGLIGYFRRSIPNFSQKAKVLFDFLKGQENTKRSKEPIQREKIHQEALDEFLTTSSRYLYWHTQTLTLHSYYTLMHHLRE